MPGIIYAWHDLCLAELGWAGLGWPGLAWPRLGWAGEESHQISLSLEDYASVIIHARHNLCLALFMPGWAKLG